MSSLNAGAPEAYDGREKESYTGPVRPDSPGRRPCWPRYELPYSWSEAHATVNARVRRYEKGDPAGRGTGNSRNGHSGKTVLTEDGAVELAVPRDRNGSFEPAIVPKGERRLDGFDDRILSLYARGMTVREIQGRFQRMPALRIARNKSFVAASSLGKLPRVLVILRSHRCRLSRGCQSTLKFDLRFGGQFSTPINGPISRFGIL